MGWPYVNMINKASGHSWMIVDSVKAALEHQEICSVKNHFQKESK